MIKGYFRTPFKAFSYLVYHDWAFFCLARLFPCISKNLFCVEHDCKMSFLIFCAFTPLFPYPPLPKSVSMLVIIARYFFSVFKTRIFISKICQPSPHKIIWCHLNVRVLKYARPIIFLCYFVNTCSCKFFTLLTMICSHFAATPGQAF